MPLLGKADAAAAGMSVSNKASTEAEAADAAPTAPAIAGRPKRNTKQSIRFGAPKSAAVSATITSIAGEDAAVSAGASDSEHAPEEDGGFELGG